MVQPNFSLLPPPPASRRHHHHEKILSDTSSPGWTISTLTGGLSSGTSLWWVICLLPDQSDCPCPPNNLTAPRTIWLPPDQFDYPFPRAIFLTLFPSNLTAPPDQLACRCPPNNFPVPPSNFPAPVPRSICLSPNKFSWPWPPSNFPVPPSNFPVPPRNLLVPQEIFLPLTPEQFDCHPINLTAPSTEQFACSPSNFPAPRTIWLPLLNTWIMCRPTTTSKFVQ